MNFNKPMFRPHCGGFAESMERCVPVDNDLLTTVRSSHPTTLWVTTKYYGEDSRLPISPVTYLVKNENGEPVGFVFEGLRV